MRRNFLEILFHVKFLRKPRKAGISSKFVCITFAQYCSLYKVVTKCNCFAKVLDKSLIEGKAILAVKFVDSHSEKFTLCSWRHCQHDVNEKWPTILQHKIVRTRRVLVVPQAMQVPIRMVGLTRIVMKTLAHARVRTQRKEWWENLPAMKAVSYCNSD